jgi:hypothetical protein
MSQWMLLRVCIVCSFQFSNRQAATSIGFTGLDRHIVVDEARVALPIDCHVGLLDQR